MTTRLPRGKAGVQAFSSRKPAVYRFPAAAYAFCSDHFSRAAHPKNLYRDPIYNTGEWGYVDAVVHLSLRYTQPYVSDATPYDSGPDVAVSSRSIDRRL